MGFYKTYQRNLKLYFIIFRTSNNPKFKLNQLLNIIQIILILLLKLDKYGILLSDILNKNNKIIIIKIKNT